MRKKTITIFEYSELTPTAQKKVLDKMRDWQVDDYDWYESELDYWKEKLDLIGFENAKIAFSGFSSQGDGASFTADVNIEKLLSSIIYRATKYKNARIFELVSLLHDKNAINIHLAKNHWGTHYSHERTISLNVDIDYPYESGSFWPKIVEQFENALDDFRIDLCHAIYKSLESEYDYLTSDESIIEMIEANDYEFTINGELA